MPWTVKAILWLVVALLVLAVVGAIYQAIATGRAERAHPPPGVMVDVGDHNSLHINCVGKGSPTVVLDAALRAMSASWVRVQQKVSATTRVCAYDRAGMGWSESGSEPRDAKQVTSELHTLLEGADIGKGPYVLVGHSYGGLYTQTYAARYPEELAGVALIESSHPDQFSRLLEPRDSNEQTKRLYAVGTLLARIGLVRLFNLSHSPSNCRTSRAQVVALNPSTRQVSTTAHEFRATPQSTAQARRLRSLGDKPLTVVSAGPQSSGWLTLQNDLATLSPNSMHRLVEGATHTSVVYERSDAQATSTAIVNVVAAVRNNQPLKQ